MQRIKKLIPNLLTLSRILVTPFIIYMGFSNHLFALIITVIVIALTDFLDGKLARLWNTTSDIGAKLDAIGDKILAICLLIILIIKNKLFIYILVFELLIALFNLYAFLKLKSGESLLIGKIKTWIIFTTIVIGLLNILFPNLNVLLNAFIVITLIFQFISLIRYISVYLEKKFSKKKN